MILRLPQGYETVIEEGGRNISGGQRQRLGLARAVFGDPRLVVLDEPDANLDADGEATLRSALMLLKRRKRTLIVITHKPLLLGTADKLMVLSEGRIQLFGNSASVMAELATRAGAGGRVDRNAARARRPAPTATETGDAKVRLTT
jgi:ABC-type protease/lipase transport system fused ATPase/permease subunit